LLADELGLEPSKELQQLESASCARTLRSIRAPVTCRCSRIRRAWPTWSCDSKP